MQELERQFMILFQVNSQISPPVSPLSDSDSNIESRQSTPWKARAGLESQNDQANATYGGESLNDLPAYEERSSVSPESVSPEGIPPTNALLTNEAARVNVSSATVSSATVSSATVSSATVSSATVSSATVPSATVPSVTAPTATVSQDSVSPESISSSGEIFRHQARLSASGSPENLSMNEQPRIAASKPSESAFQTSTDSMLLHSHPYIPGCFWSKYQNPIQGSTDDEFQDEVHHMNPVMPVIPRYKSNRLSVLSIASSIAMMAPFIRSQSNDDSATSPSDYYIAKDSQQFSSGNDDTMTKVYKRPGKSVNDKEKISNINRLSVLMQRAIINGKKKRNQGITEQTIEEWSSSLESCFEIPELHTMSLDFPEDQHNVSTAGAQSDRGLKKLSTVTSRTKKSINSWGRKSRLWFTGSKNQSSEYEFNDDCSLLTVPDQTTERVYYATAPHRLSQATINRELSLNTATATVSPRKSLLWNGGGGNSSNAKPDRKHGKISRFFKSLLPSQRV